LDSNRCGRAWFFFNPKPKMKNMGTPGFEPGGFRDSGHGRLS
jgi:hypothetical protein